MLDVTLAPPIAMRQTLDFFQIKRQPSSLYVTGDRIGLSKHRIGVRHDDP